MSQVPTIKNICQLIQSIKTRIGNFVLKTGDTMSGNLTISKTTPTLTGKATNVDMKQSNNGISANVWPGLSVQDKNGYGMSGFYSAPNTNGTVGTGMWVYNRDASGTQVTTGSLVIRADKSGNITYAVTAPGAFRNAIGASNGIWPVALGGTGTATASPNRVFAGPSSGTDAAAPSFRALVAADIPNLNASKITAGTLALARGGTASDNTARAANTVFAGPSSGSAGNATWRALVAADIPNLNASKITAGTLPVARGGTGKTYGYTWQQLATGTGATARTYDLTNYSEIMIVCKYSTSYAGSVVIPKAQLSATATEWYLGGGHAGDSANPLYGRRACCNVTLTSMTPRQVVVDAVNRTSSATWWVYAR